MRSADRRTAAEIARPRGRARHRRFLPARSTCPTLERARRARASSTAPPRPRRGAGGKATSSSSAAATRPARRRCTSARYAARVTMLVRGATLAATMSDYLCRRSKRPPNIDVAYETEVVGGSGEHRLERLTLLDKASGRKSTVDADALFVMIGAQPWTEWLPPEIERDEWGYILTGTDLESGNGRVALPRGDQPRPRLRRRRRPPRRGQAGRLGGRRGLDRDPAGAPLPRSRGRGLG